MNRLPRRKNKNKNKNKQKQIIGPRQQFDNNINLYTERTFRNITEIINVYGYVTSGNYSFSASSDVRYLTFTTVLSGSSEFTNLATSFRDFRIRGANVMVLPVYNYDFTTSVANVTPLYYLVDPQAASGGANPTNLAVCNNDESGVLPYSVIRPIVTKYTFPGTGFSNNVWQNTSLIATIEGALYIGAISSAFTTTTTPWFQIKMDLVVEFANPI